MATEISGNDTNILHYKIVGSRRFSNIFFGVIVAIGAIGFLLAGLSSYLHTPLLPMIPTPDLQFVPQGLALTGYGAAGILLDIYLWAIVVLDVGSGFNEFNQNSQKARIFRLGYPGKNRKIDFEYDLKDIQAIRVEIRNGLNPKRALYIRVKGKNDIPITQVGQPMALSKLEDRAAELAKFLGVPLEGL
ncbi:Photosystem I assembly protein ycf4 [Thalassoporum mexicanum PCC 7367]|uniref:photosystem I assembly protein Ycf4 n=1 Tax=Thalassoporum mexicanum TaxID=3457544 RepID=UPI00029FF542|nr:photosystem I assembly protein Ycf4 [Pseudanabaena sp. PCC 7367]AFY71408.1 Photosystem I assembly protein ycf4 [Pseudanabaena sp. PCC 7367]